MINLRGKIYKLVYLDTNALSEFTNNTKNFTKNLLTLFVDDHHLFVTSVFNILELSRTCINFKQKIKNSLGTMPLGILESIENLCNFEINGVSINNNLVMFAVGERSIFNVHINDLFCFLEEPQMKLTEAQRQAQIREELLEWETERNNQNPNWQKNLSTTLFATMLRISTHLPPELSLSQSQLPLCYSLQIRSYIRNMFIHSQHKKLDTNSVIDSYNASYLPYVDVYITERTVGAWLENAKSKFPFIKQKTICKISTFFDQSV